MTAKRNDNIPPQDVLDRLFTYDPITGDLRWKRRTVDFFTDNRFHTAEMQCAVWNKRHAGDIAFRISNSGYRQGAIFGKPVSAHRVVWKLIFGTDAVIIDHINGNRADNRLENLRECTSQENMRNQRRRFDSKSGVCGVTWNKGVGKWQAQIKVNGKNIYLGIHESIEDASDAYQKAKLEYGFHRLHGEGQEIRGLA